MATQSWISNTGQFWKIGVFYFLLLVSFVAMLAFMLSVNGYLRQDHFSKFELASAFILLGLLSLMWLCIAIRCPRCGKRPVWDMIKAADVNSWLINIHVIDRCQKCE